MSEFLCCHFDKRGIYILLLLLLTVGSLDIRAEQLILEKEKVSELLKIKGEWIVKRWEQRMGVAEKCAQGLSYIFDYTGKATVIKCENRTINTKNCGWSLSQSDDGVVLELCEIKYSVRAKIDSGRTTMRLTTLPTAKDELEEVLTMKFSPEQ